MSDYGNFDKRFLNVEFLYGDRALPLFGEYLHALKADRAHHEEIALTIESHNDDESIGPGATRSTLSRLPSVFQLTLLLAADNVERVEESRQAAKQLNLPPESFLPIGFSDGDLTSHQRRMLRFLHLVDDILQPSLVLTHVGEDCHRDHQTVHALVSETFNRPGANVWCYAIPQPIDSQPQLTLYARVDEPDVFNKFRQFQSFSSEGAKDYFDLLVHLGVLRCAGSHAGADWAEGFATENLWLSSHRCNCGRPTLGRPGEPDLVHYGKDVLRASRVVLAPCPICGVMTLAPLGQKQRPMEVKDLHHLLQRLRKYLEGSDQSEYE